MIRYRLEYLAVMLVSTLVRVLPRRASLAVGSGLGWLFHLLHGRRRELAVDNLRQAFPRRSEAECRAILRQTFRHFGRHVVELLYFDGLSADELMQQVEIEGEENVEQALAGGRGAMFFSGHFGYWELQVMQHSVRFSPVVMMARTLDNPLIERVIERLRARVGTRVIPRRGAIRGMFRALLDGASVGMMIDQHIQDRSAVVVNFFDRPASTTSAVAALALRADAPVIPVFALPLSDGRYRMIYESPVEPPAPDDPDPIRTYTQRCTDVLEMYVRRYPELWLWMHRRWRVPAPDTATEPEVAPPADARSAGQGGRPS